ncbi:hypothetical protein LJC71_07600, partial [Desulfosarcina sp. OttesenSCG-928-A07]|nr:hypothetical protein [Desulfosarcina sp. OttesenSCG-928-A07]
MHHNPAIDAILTRMTSPTCVEEVLTLPSFYNLLGEFEKTSGMSVDAMSREDQDRIVQRRLRQLVDICRINPIWHKRIDDALGAEPADSFDAFQHIPLTDKDTFAAMFTGGRPGMVVPIDRCGFEIVASGGTSSGQPNETVYPLDELQET